MIARLHASTAADAPTTPRARELYAYERSVTVAVSGEQQFADIAHRFAPGKGREHPTCEYTIYADLKFSTLQGVRIALTCRTFGGGDETAEGATGGELVVPVGALPLLLQVLEHGIESAFAMGHVNIPLAGGKAREA